MKGSMKRSLLWTGMCIFMVLGLARCTLASEGSALIEAETGNVASQTETENTTEAETTTEAATQPATTIAGTETAKESMPDTGLVVCIDPGHFKGASSLEGENLYGYEEGVFTLKIALALRTELSVMVSAVTLPEKQIPLILTDL